MTATPVRESTSPSRRALLTGVLGGLGALAASAAGRPQVAQAHDPDDVRLGGGNTATATTQITNSGNNQRVFWGESLTGTGVYGSSLSSIGVEGFCSTGDAISGVSGDGFGVRGNSTTFIGVQGFSPAANQPATVGWSGGNRTGVLGYSNDSSGSLPSSKPKTGVYGFADQDDGAIGVFGQSGAGIGVQGLSDDNVGVFGRATASSGATFGVFGRAESVDGVGLGARSAGSGTAVLAISGTGGFPATKAKTAIYGYAAQDSTSKALWGETTSGHAVHGSATSGYAGYFTGKVYTSSFHEMTEIVAPSAPTTNKARLFLRDNGSGKTQLCVRFNTGAIQVLATQP